MSRLNTAAVRPLGSALLLLIVLGALVYVSLHLDAWRLERAGASSTYDGQRLIDAVWQRIQRDHAEPHEDRELARAAIMGILARIDDPHAALLSREQYEMLVSESSGSYGGVGAEIGMRDGTPTILSVQRGGGAHRAGILPGDEVRWIDGTPTDGWSLDEVILRARGEVGSAVRLGISSSETLRDVVLLRSEVRSRSVASAIVDADGIGYVELANFSETSAEEMLHALDSLSRKGAHSLILDLRENPGGLVDAAEDVASLFLAGGDTVAVLRGRTDAPTEALVVRRSGPFQALPLVVLIGPESASAAEILAGALGDHGRATLVGTPSYGKGSVQSLFPMPGDFWLKITTGYWLTPEGNSIQAVPGQGADVFASMGVQPDIVARDARDSLFTSLRHHIGGLWPTFHDAMFAAAVDAARVLPEVEPDPLLYVAEWDSLFASALAARALSVPDSLLERSAPWVRNRLGAEVAFIRWGEGSARRWLNTTDPVFAAARALLRPPSPINTHATTQ